MEHFKKYIAEMIGTFVLVTFGCGTAVAVGCDSVMGSGYVLTALAFGLSIVAMAHSIGNISGCHVNPAVSLAMLIRRQLSGMDFVGYVVAQLVGALLGCLVIGAVFGFDCSFGANQIQATWPQGNIPAALLVEVVLTFVFVIAVVGVTSKTSNGVVCGVVIGLTLTLVHILGIALTGTSVNPARSLLPALFAGGEALRQVWIFIVAPLVGGALAALVYMLIETRGSDDGEAELSEANADFEMEVEGTRYDASENVRSHAESARGNARSQVEGARDSARSHAESARGSARSHAESARDSARSKAEDARSNRG